MPGLASSSYVPQADQFSLLLQETSWKPQMVCSAQAYFK